MTIGKVKKLVIDKKTVKLKTQLRTAPIQQLGAWDMLQVTPMYAGKTKDLIAFSISLK